MPNHIHMIIIINDGTMWSSSPTVKSIPQIIKIFKTLVSKELGKPIFQRSYYDHIIRNQQDYEDAWNYTDGNPSKWQEDELY